MPFKNQNVDTKAITNNCSNFCDKLYDKAKSTLSSYIHSKHFKLRKLKCNKEKSILTGYESALL